MTDNDKTGSIICDNVTRTFSKEVYFGDGVVLTVAEREGIVEWEDAAPKLKTLGEFNEDKRREYEVARKPRPNGIACPECGAELWDSNPMVMLTSYPPQMNVCCSACDYRGYRVA